MTKKQMAEEIKMLKLEKKRLWKQIELLNKDLNNYLFLETVKTENGA